MKLCWLFTRSYFNLWKKLMIIKVNNEWEINGYWSTKNKNKFLREGLHEYMELVPGPFKGQPLIKLKIKIYDSILEIIFEMLWYKSIIITV